MQLIPSASNIDPCNAWQDCCLLDSSLVIPRIAQHIDRISLFWKNVQFTLPEVRLAEVRIDVPVACVIESAQEIDHFFGTLLTVILDVNNRLALLHRLLRSIQNLHVIAGGHKLASLEFMSVFLTNKNTKDRQARTISSMPSTSIFMNDGHWSAKTLSSLTYRCVKRR